jgi:hypothetical protein
MAAGEPEGSGRATSTETGFVGRTLFDLLAMIGLLMLASTRNGSRWPWETQILSQAAGAEKLRTGASRWIAAFGSQQKNLRLFIHFSSDKTPFCRIT